MGSSKVKVCLKNSFKVTTFLDTGTEINIMTKKLIEDANLAIKQGPKLKLISHTGHN